ncbi:MAG: sigma-70 family RNA polymerase sigma factor [Propionicimonas sp.]|nr:sigma-70 family RNA polymerase sigma factor [Propionicimonas sp.]
MSTVPGTEQRTFDAFVREIAEPVRRYLARRTDPDTAEEAFAETLLVCWRRVADLPSEPLPWVFVVARNCLANAERSRRRRDRLVHRLRTVEPPAVAPGPGDGPDHAPVHAAMAKLRAADAEVLRLWAWEDLTPPQIALVLGVSENAAAIRLHRAKRRLREALGKAGPAAGHVGSERREQR